MFVLLLSWQQCRFCYCMQLVLLLLLLCKHLIR
jgi:hypothetical protein